MGEIIFSFVVGGCLIACGILNNQWLSREQRKTAEADAAEGGANE